MKYKWSNDTGRFGTFGVGTCTGIVEPFQYPFPATTHPQFLILQLWAPMGTCLGHFGMHCKHAVYYALAITVMLPMQHQYTTQLTYTAKKYIAFPELICYVYLMLHLGYPKVYSWSLCSLSGWCTTWVASEPCWYSWIWIIRQPCGKLGQGSTEIQFSLCVHHNLWCSSFWQ